MSRVRADPATPTSPGPAGRLVVPLPRSPRSQPLVGNRPVAMSETLSLNAPHHPSLCALLYVLDRHGTDISAKEKVVRCEMPGDYEFPSPGCAPLLSHFPSLETKAVVAIWLYHCVSDPHNFEKIVLQPTISDNAVCAAVMSWTSRGKQVVNAANYNDRVEVFQRAKIDMCIALIRGSGVVEPLLHLCQRENMRDMVLLAGGVEPLAMAVSANCLPIEQRCFAVEAIYNLCAGDNATARQTTVLGYSCMSQVSNLFSAPSPSLSTRSSTTTTNSSDDPTHPSIHTPLVKFLQADPPIDSMLVALDLISLLTVTDTHRLYLCDAGGMQALAKVLKSSEQQLRAKAHDVFALLMLAQNSQTRISIAERLCDLFELPRTAVPLLLNSEDPIHRERAVKNLLGLILEHISPRRHAAPSSSTILTRDTSLSVSTIHTSITASAKTAEHTITSPPAASESVVTAYNREVIDIQTRLITEFPNQNQLSLSDIYIRHVITECKSRHGPFEAHRQAYEMLRESFAWRAQNLQNVQTTEISLPHLVWHGCDPYNRPILYVRPAFRDASFYHSESHLRASVLAIEEGIHQMAFGVVQFVVVVDVRGANISLLEFKLAKLHMSMLSRAFPERLGAMIVVPAAWSVRLLYAVVCMTIPAHIRNRILLMNNIRDLQNSPLIGHSLPDFMQG